MSLNSFHKSTALMLVCSLYLIGHSAPRNAIIVPLKKTSATWNDLLYLSAIPAGARLNDGKPVVLATDMYGTIRPELSDYLKRYKPKKTYVFDCFGKPVPVAKGMVAYWPFEKSAAGIQRDVIGSAKAIYYRVPEWKTRATDFRTFDGRTIDFTSGLLPGTGKELTVAFWMNPDVEGYSRPIERFSKGNREPGWQVLLTGGKQNTIRFAVGGGRGAWGKSHLVAKDAFSINTWTHVACTHADETSKIYINGKLAATRKHITWSTPNNRNDPLLIGSGTKNELPYSGLLDDVRIYHSALKLSEIEALAQGRDTTSKPVGHWPMDTFDGKIIEDAMGQFNLKVEGKPVCEAGRIKGALRFKGKADPSQLKQDATAMKPFTMAARVTAGSTSVPVVLLNKLYAVDQTPPWSLWTLPDGDGTNVAFQLGSNPAHRVISATTLPADKPVSVVVTVKDGHIALFLDGKLSGTKASVAWQSKAVEWPKHVAHGHAIDHVTVYPRILRSDEIRLIAVPTTPVLKQASMLQYSHISPGKPGSEDALPSFERGPQGGHALRFNGRNFLQTSNPVLSDQFSVAFWIKVDGAGCIMNALPRSPKQAGWGIFVEGPGEYFRLRFRAGGGLSAQMKTDLGHRESYLPGQWVHVGICFGDTRATLYLNGRFADHKEFPKEAKVNGALPLTIGALEPGLQHIKGSLDDLRFYNRVLDEDEVLTLFASRMNLGSMSPLPAESLDSATVALAQRFWRRAETVVCCNAQDYASALAASALAGRLRVPLVYSGNKGLSRGVLAGLKALRTRRVIWIGKRNPARAQIGRAKLKLKELLGPVDVVRFLKAKGLPVTYFAAANPRDRGSIGSIKKTSLVAPLLAVGRTGVVTIIDAETMWLKRFPVTRKSKEAPAGAPAESPEYKSGIITGLGEPIHYVFAYNKDGGGAKVFIDRGRDGQFDTKGDGPFSQPEVLTLAGKQYLFTKGPVRGKVVDEYINLTRPTPAEIRDMLKPYAQALGNYPEYLCIVGRTDVIPSGIAGSSVNKVRYIPNDIELSQTDDDPFVELATGRMVAEDVWTVSLVASRCLSYEHLLDTSWFPRYGAGGWTSRFTPLFSNVGFEVLPHDPAHTLYTQKTPLRSLAALVHNQHSVPDELGHLVHWSSKVLLSPMLIESGGCTTCRMKVPPHQAHQSAPMRLLRNGAVGFSGNRVEAICTQELYRWDFWNAVLQGKSLGQAHRQGQNAYIPELKGHVFFPYQFYARTLFGDPALKLAIPAQSKVQGARMEEKDGLIRVHAPETWWTIKRRIGEHYQIMSTSFGGLNISFDTVYRRGQSWYYIAKFRTTEKVKSIQQVTKVEAPLGWDGTYFVDEHQDGSRSIVWRVKLIDVDEKAKKIRKAIDHIDYKIITQP